jgi:putative peptidoglycan lipid II flippase
MTEPEERSASAPIAGGIAGAAAIIMLGNLFSRLLGMVREQLAAGRFGTGDPIAAFTVADNVHTLLFDLLMSGMLQAALVPVLAQWTAPAAATRLELRRITGTLLVLASLIVGTMVAAGVIFAPRVVDVMTSLGGDERSPTTTALTVTLVRIILPAVFFLSIGVVLMAELYALGRVTGPALATGARNAAIVGAMVLLAGQYGVKSMAIGVVAGSIAILAIQVYALAKADALPIPNLAFRHAAVRQVSRLYLPVFLGLLVNTAAVVVDRNLAWNAQEDALGAMRYATTLVQLVLGLVAAGISLASLPALSRHFAAGDEVAFRATLRRALGIVTLLIVPAVAGLAVAAVPVVDLLFRHGETTGHGAHLIVIALLGYLPGTFFAAYDQVLIFALYARHDTKRPVIVGIVSVLVYFAVALPAADRWGMIGLVIANSAQFIVHAAIMFWLARPFFAGGEGRRLAAMAARCTSAGIGLAVAAGGCWLALDRLADESLTGIAKLAQEAFLAAIPLGIGGAVYLAVLHRMRLPELVQLRSALGRKLGRI